MGPRHTRDHILAGAMATAVEDGLSQLSYGRVARRLGINDRTVVYYFPSMAELINDVLMSIGVQLQQTLAPAVTAPAADHVALTRAAWPVVANPSGDAVFALFFEAMGLAAAGRAPYADVVPQLVEAWIDWASQLIDGPPAVRRVEAETAIAVIDGLLLLRHLAGHKAAERAAHRMGVRPTH